MYAVSGDGKRTEHASYNEAIERFKEIRTKGIKPKWEDNHYDGPDGEDDEEEDEDEDEDEEE